MLTTAHARTAPPFLSSTFLPADPAEWSPLHATAWAHTLALPESFQDHLLDANVDGDALVHLSDKEVERVVEGEGEKQRCLLALQCLRYVAFLFGGHTTGPHAQIFHHYQQKALLSSIGETVTIQQLTIRKDLSTIYDRIVQALRELTTRSAPTHNDVGGGQVGFGGDSFMQGMVVGGLIAWFLLRWGGARSRW
ncbi:hypothetical protein DFJ77DRAFT_464937 [Powellomyces hirtus]|nr:hypothetical protein DFJ77DRAFT_464937 [Powellomyces hirtus]